MRFVQFQKYQLYNRAIDLQPYHGLVCSELKISLSSSTFFAQCTFTKAWKVKKIKSLFEEASQEDTKMGSMNKNKDVNYGRT